jgi:hypothetical protein
VVSGPSVTGSGTFSCTSPTASGTWNMTLEQEELGLLFAPPAALKVEKGLYAPLAVL